MDDKTQMLNAEGNEEVTQMLSDEGEETTQMLVENEGDATRILTEDDMESTQALIESEVEEVTQILVEGSEEEVTQILNSEPRMCVKCFRTYKGGQFCPHCGTMAKEEEESYCLPAGTKLNERYVLGEAVNNGGFGILYRAWDEVLQRVVAVKECYPTSLVTRPMGSKNVVVNSSKVERFDEYQQILDDYVLEGAIMSRFSKARNVCNV